MMSTDHIERDVAELLKATTRQELILEQLTKITSDHETRLRWMERTIGYGLGATAVIYFIVEKFII